MSDKKTVVAEKQNVPADKSRIPTGSLILRTLAMPADTNATD